MPFLTFTHSKRAAVLPISKTIRYTLLSLRDLAISFSPFILLAVALLAVAYSLVGKPRVKAKAFRFSEESAEQPLLLPGRDSDIRAGFDVLFEQLGLHYQVLAEVDDMAMLRLLARNSGNTALQPTVVVQDELKSGKLQEYCVVPQLYENFYAITVQRHFEPPLLKTLLRRSEAEVLGAA